MGARKKQEKRRHRHVPEEGPPRHGVRGHPAQGRTPHDPHRTPHLRSDPGPFHPYAGIPGVLHPAVAGAGSLVFGGRHLPAGPFTGIGPRGYRRSDERVFEEVCDRLTEHGELDVRDVTVEVAGGEVTLEGTVPDRFTKRACERVAEDVVGVLDVHNRLRMGTPLED